MYINVINQKICAPKIMILVFLAIHLSLKKVKIITNRESMEFSEFL